METKFPPTVLHNQPLHCSFLPTHFLKKRSKLKLGFFFVCLFVYCSVLFYQRLSADKMASPFVDFALFKWIYFHILISIS